MNESIGQQLKQMRESNSLSIEQASRATHIRLHYLKAIEAGDLNALPSTAQVRGFIRAYASYLGMEQDQIMEALAREVPSTPPPSTPRRPVPAVEQDGTQPEGIEFIEIGARLKTQRELLGLTLEDVERHTHIRSHYIRSLESGDLSGLPSPVQGRGMLGNYSNFLGMDSEPLMLKFAEGLQARLAARQAVQPRRRAPATRAFWSERSPLQRLLSTDFFLVGLVVLSLAGFVVWGGLRIVDLRAAGADLAAEGSATSNPMAGTPIPTGILASAGSTDAEGTSGAPGSAGTQENSPEGAASEDEQPVDPLAHLLYTATATESASLPAATAPIQVFVMVRQRTWMRAVVDDQIEFEGRVTPGSAYEFDGETRVEILTGNGAGLQLYYNQQDQGLMGLLGQVVHRIFTREGPATPTATTTPTGMPPATATMTPEGSDLATITPGPGQQGTPAPGTEGQSPPLPTPTATFSLPAAPSP